MDKITGKTVYVLGAGASEHVKAPLLKDFLLSARLLYEGGEDLRYGESFKRVFSMIDALRASSYYVKFDLNNLEDVFSLAEMTKQVGFGRGERIVSDLNYVIMETLDRCETPYKNGQILPDPIYESFIRNIKNMGDLRKNDVQGSRYHYQPDVIITFNYDVSLDYAMFSNNTRPDYRLITHEKGKGGRFPLLKLHGSINWIACRNCNPEKKGVPDILPIYPMHGLGVPDTPATGTLKFRIATDLLYHRSCSNCKKSNCIEPIVIPPTWSKAVGGTPLANVWRATVTEINTAFQIIVIGYSLPETDTFFQYLLTLGLQINPRLQRIVVVNPDGNNSLRERYKRVFARSMSDDGRLQFSELRFVQYAGRKHEMERVGMYI